MRKTALWKDAWRTISGNGRRFAAIAIIVAVGVMMLGGLNAVGRDIRAGLDDFFDTTGMHDVSVVSTLGLDDADIAALRKADGIADAAGVREQGVTTRVDGKSASATVTALNDRHIDEPYLNDGRLPKHAHEIVVTRQYLDDSGKRIGDKVTFSPDDSAAYAASATATFEDGAYTIVGVVTDPNDIVNPSGPLALVSGAKTVYPMFVAADAVANDAMPYASAAVAVRGAKAMNTYADDYLDKVDAAKTAIEDAAPANAKWIVNDRGAITSYEDVKTQSEMISRLGTLFPVLFLVIALLVSLTAITRMVEEDRQLIGTYKAIGYTRREIMVKYLVYSCAACLLGGVIGDLLGLVGLPFAFTRRMLTNIYVLPSYPLLVDWRLAVGGVLLFVAVITGAATAACAGSLRLQPAELMRPKAPKAGRTIILQRIGFIWNHLSFLGKVTARNLFRYKSRALMVIIGVLGCTALMTAGFGMGSSALTLMPRQHGEISLYDVMAVTSAVDHDKAQQDLDKDRDVESTLPLQLGSATLSSPDSDGGKIAAQLMVIPDGESLDGYIDLHTTDGAPIGLRDADGIVVTANAAKKLALVAGDKVDMADAMADSATPRVHALAQYYTGNVVFMTRSAYEKAFDADYAPNADLITVKGDDDAQIAFANRLASQDEYLSVTSSAKQERDFSKSFLIFFVMIGFIVAMAAILAVVVLYTLASTNISERERELATIKVLGFRRREVHGYVNKEMLLLSAFGIAIGLPCGRGLLGFLVSRLDLPGMNIVPNVLWYCYAAAAVLAFLFTLLVGLATNHALDRIDMVGALKSPE
ncbi:FtsX-like permease family protein [Bifidobacterium sp. CP2]|uniref:ABC transporter permease n=1 Tax=Bifidobacterium sp. CP2 TaxID=2809025 RepID=UPI001BDBEEBE|nr:ABC transporter permease [Bifidobacterium sp. CP2]MBT1181938.1 FtsX-like permease family protein [Bifidobacterium sp. CP2]